jgi:hypothetical protein
VNRTEIDLEAKDSGSGERTGDFFSPGITVAENTRLLGRSEGDQKRCCEERSGEFGKLLGHGVD